MLIEIESLTRSGKSFAHTYATTELALDEEDVQLLDAVEVRGSAARAGARVRLSGEIKTRVEKACDRCLRPVVMQVETSFDVVYVPPAEDAMRESPVLEAEDLDVSVHDDVAVDLDEVVREQVLLAVEERALCKEDCRGLCLECGANLNDEQCGCKATAVDPRWAALAALRDEQTES